MRFLGTADGPQRGGQAGDDRRGGVGLRQPAEVLQGLGRLVQVQQHLRQPQPRRRAVGVASQRLTVVRGGLGRLEQPLHHPAAPQPRLDVVRPPLHPPVQAVAGAVQAVGAQVRLAGDVQHLVQPGVGAVDQLLDARVGEEGKAILLHLQQEPFHVGLLAVPAQFQAEVEAAVRLLE
ncbi:MAG: hypothetical protein U0797_11505 [Gemmataceae bacterium]